MKNVLYFMSIIFLSYAPICHPMERDITTNQALAEEVIKAAHTGNVPRLRKLSRQTNIAHVVDETFGASPLFWAIDANSEETVKFLLDETTIDVNKRNKFLTTPLLFAVEKPGKLAIVKLLLAKNGIDLEAKGSGNVTALQRADAEYKEILKAAGSDISWNPYELAQAINLGQIEKLRQFIKEHRSKFTSTHFIEAILVAKRHPESLEILLQEFFGSTLVRVMWSAEVATHENFDQLFDKCTEIGELVLLDHNLNFIAMWLRPEKMNGIDQETYKKNVLTGRVLQSPTNPNILILITKKI